MQSGQWIVAGSAMLTMKWPSNDCIASARRVQDWRTPTMVSSAKFSGSTVSVKPGLCGGYTATTKNISAGAKSVQVLTEMASCGVKPRHIWSQLHRTHDIPAPPLGIPSRQQVTDCVTRLRNKNLSDFFTLMQRLNLAILDILLLLVDSQIALECTPYRYPSCKRENASRVRVSVWVCCPNVPADLSSPTLR